MSAWFSANAGEERKTKDTDEQFLYPDARGDRALKKEDVAASAPRAERDRRVDGGAGLMSHGQLKINDTARVASRLSARRCWPIASRAARSCRRWGDTRPERKAEGSLTEKGSGLRALKGLPVALSLR